MIAISGMLYRLVRQPAKLHDRSIRHNKIRTYAILFILAEALTTPIFSMTPITGNAEQVITVVCCVNDCIPRNKLWGHKHSCQMPDQVLCILEGISYMLMNIRC